MSATGKRFKPRLGRELRWEVDFGLSRHPGEGRGPAMVEEIPRNRLDSGLRRNSGLRVVSGKYAPAYSAGITASA